VRCKAWWRQSNIECAESEEYASCWVHQYCHVADVQKLEVALNKAAGVSGGKDEFPVRLKGRERDYWMGIEIGMFGGYGFQVTAGDGPEKKSKLGAIYNNLRRKKKKQQCKVGGELEGSSSNRPELAALLLALRDMLVQEQLLYLCDNPSLMKAVNNICINRWIGEGGKAALIKVKAHQREPVNASKKPTC